RPAIRRLLRLGGVAGLHSQGRSEGMDDRRRQALSQLQSEREEKLGKESQGQNRQGRRQMAEGPAAGTIRPPRMPGRVVRRRRTRSNPPVGGPCVTPAAGAPRVAGPGRSFWARSGSLSRPPFWPPSQ